MTGKLWLFRLWVKCAKHCSKGNEVSLSLHSELAMSVDNDTAETSEKVKILENLYLLPWAQSFQIS